jgi:hypothetical protein
MLVFLVIGRQLSLHKLNMKVIYFLLDLPSLDERTQLFGV